MSMDYREGVGQLSFRQCVLSGQWPMVQPYGLSAGQADAMLRRLQRMSAIDSAGVCAMRSEIARQHASRGAT